MHYKNFFGVSELPKHEIFNTGISGNYRNQNRTFEVQKFSRNLPKMLPKLKNFGKVQNFRYFRFFLDFSENSGLNQTRPNHNRLKISHFEVIFDHFWLLFKAKFLDLFSDFRNSLSFGISYRNKNVPEISFRNFWFWTGIFAKIHRTSKLLTERIALLSTLWKKSWHEIHTIPTFT